MGRSSFFVSCLVGALLSMATPTAAQLLGAFTWQLQPYCNVVTLTVIRQGDIFTLDGFDDQCGGARASASGMAFLNPDGSIGIGVAIVTPGGSPLHVGITLSLATLSGGWRDTAGGSGVFAFAQRSGGAPRPVPSAGLAVTALTVSGNSLFGGTISAGTQFQIGGATVLSTPGTANVTIGPNAAIGAGAITNAAAIGARAIAESPNTLVLGQVGGKNGATGGTTVLIGTTADTVVGAALQVVGPGRSNDPDAPSVIRVGAPTTLQGFSYNALEFGEPNGAYIAEIGEDDSLLLSAPQGIELFANANEIIGPFTDNSNFLGAPSRRWRAVYAVNGAIQTSDARLKREVTDLDYGLAAVLALRPVRFRWNDGTDEAQHIGLIAQEVDRVVPEAIAHGATPAEPLGMSYDALVPVLVNAIKELQQRNEELERRLVSLETAAKDGRK